MPKRKFTIFLVPIEDGVYLAVSPFYPGCVTDGDTPEEALAHAKEAMEGILEADARNNGDPVPSYVHASHVVVGEVEVEVPDSLLEPEAKKVKQPAGG